MIISHVKRTAGIVGMLSLGQFLLALITVSPLSSAVAAGLGQRPILVDAVRGDWLDAVATITAATAAHVTPASRELDLLPGAILLTAAVGGLSTILQHLLYIALSGPAVAKFAGSSLGVPALARQWFWPMLRASILMLAVSGLVLLIVAIALAVARANSALALAVMALAWTVLTSFFELTRTAMVVADRRSAFRGLWSAAGMLTRRPLRLAGTWLALALGNLLVFVLIGLITLGTDASQPILAWLTTLFVVVSTSGCKIVRLAVQYHVTLMAAPRLDERGFGLE